MANPGVTAPRSKRPDELLPGDIVEIAGAPFEILAESFLGMSGASMFDVHAFFWRARVRPLGGASVGHATWAVDEAVIVCGRRACA